MVPRFLHLAPDACKQPHSQLSSSRVDLALCLLFRVSTVGPVGLQRHSTAVTSSSLWLCNWFCKRLRRLFILAV